MMTTFNSYEEFIEIVRAKREKIGAQKVSIGIDLVNAGKQYGSGLIERSAAEIGLAVSTLKEYRRVARYLITISDGDQLAAVRLFKYEASVLSYSHIRAALRKTPHDNAAFSALKMVIMGDDDHPEFNKNLPMSVDCFTAYLAAVYGDSAGTAWLVNMEYSNGIQAMNAIKSELLKIDGAVCVKIWRP